MSKLSKKKITEIVKDMLSREVCPKCETESFKAGESGVNDENQLTVLVTCDCGFKKVVRRLVK